MQSIKIDLLVDGIEDNYTSPAPARQPIGTVGRGPKVVLPRSGLGNSPPVLGFPDLDLLLDAPGRE